MKGEDIVAIGLMGVVILGWWAMAEAGESESNKVMKQCLQEHNYTPDKFHNYDFGPAAACHGEWAVADLERNIEKQKKFLEENPWYRGSDWNWQETAGYNCEKIYNNSLMNTITLCSKPTYVN